MSSVWEGTKTEAFVKGAELGAERERQRIIALLQKMVGNMDGNYYSPKEVYGGVLDAIELIKGESE